MHEASNYFKYFKNESITEIKSSKRRSCALSIGTHLAIKKIVHEYSLQDILRKNFSDKSGFILDLASYLIVSEDNVGQYYPEYAFCHPLFTDKMKIYSDSSVSRLLSEITKDQIISSLNEWNSKQDHRQRIYLSYDSTNKNCQAGDIDIIEYGAAKVKRGSPIFNLSVAFDKTNQVPLFYELYPGSINDVSQLKYLVDKVIEYGYSHIGFILDRGYFSQENIEYLDKKKYPFIIMAKGHKDIVSKIVESKKHTFESKWNCFIENYGVYGTSQKAKLFSTDEKDRWFHVYYSAEKAAIQRANLEDHIKQLAKSLSLVEGEKVEVTKEAQHYFQCFYNNTRFLFAKAKTEVIEKELDLCGYFCIITSEEMSAQDAYVLYKGRDASEKLFRSDKTFLGSNSMRVHSDQSLQAKIFLEFIALIIRNRLYNLLKEQMQRLNVKKNYLTVPAALRELDKLEMVRVNQGKYILDHAITKNQRCIFASLGITDADIKTEAAVISSTLEHSDSQEYDSGEDDE